MKLVLLLVLSAFILGPAHGQTVPTEKTLLWRISGKGHTPSYLFGTMHVHDPEMFNFQDSVYFAIEKSQAFALEFNPDSVGQIMLDAIRRSYSEEEDLTFDTNSFDTTAWSDDPDLLDSIQQQLKVQLFDQIIKELVNAKKKSSQMPTFMDGWLYSLARAHQRRIFGLEKKEDHFVSLEYAKNSKKNQVWVDLARDKELPAGKIPYFYSKEDVDSMHWFMERYYDSAALEPFLYKRNHEMVRSIDSIMENFTLFAAVGAAHLGGDKGVISLLRKKGYTVEPVFSNKRIPAAEYPVPPIELKWTEFKVPEFGFLFSMPGLASSISTSEYSYAYQFYDIGTGIVYLAHSAKLASGERTDSLLRASIESMLDSDSRISSVRKTTINGFDVREYLCRFDVNNYERIVQFYRDNVQYLLTVKGETRGNVYNDDADRFFHSFQLLDQTPGYSWQKFTSEEEGFEVDFPGTPRSEDTPLDTETAESLWMRAHSWFDVKTGLALTLIHQKAKIGHEFTSGNDHFESYLESLAADAVGDFNKTELKIDDYAATRFNYIDLEGQEISGLLVKRENTCYFLITGGDTTATSRAIAERFFASFSLKPFRKSEWKQQNLQSGNFTVWAPGTMEEVIRDSTDWDYSETDREYRSFDADASIAYTVEEYPLNPYFWAENRDSVFQIFRKRVIGWSDSLISERIVEENGTPALELRHYDFTRDIIRRTRILLNDTGIYVVATLLPLTHGDTSNIDRFFSSFRFNEVISSEKVFVRNSDKLFSDLSSPSEEIHTPAFEALMDVYFTVKDTALLTQKILEEYPVEGVNDHLFLELELLAARDSMAKLHVLNFINQHYAQGHEVLKYLGLDMLGMLAETYTLEWYQNLAALMKKELPQGESWHKLYNNIADSLELTNQIFPDLLPFISDSEHGDYILYLAAMLADSGYVTATTLKPVQKEIMKKAEELKKEALKKDAIYVSALPSIIKLLQLLGTDDADRMVSGFLQSPTPIIKLEAAIAMIKKGKRVNTKIIKELSALKSSRLTLYEELKKEGKEKLMPADFRTQKQMAESYLYQSDYDDMITDEMELVYIKEMIHEVDGREMRYYLFRVPTVPPDDTIIYEDTKIDVIDSLPSIQTPEFSYLAIAGPFEMDRSIITINGDNCTGVYQDAPFFPAFNEYMFKEHVKKCLADYKNYQ